MDTKPINAAVISYAILKVNFDQFRRDYLENFVPLVAECIRTNGTDVVSSPELQQRMLVQFGLPMPHHVLSKILKRLRKAGHIHESNGVYAPNHASLKTLNFKQVQQEAMKQHEDLIAGLVAFSRERYGVVMQEREADEAFLSYLEDNQLLVLHASLNHADLEGTAAPSKSRMFIVASYIRYLQAENMAGFEHVETIVKGNMLANAIFLFPEVSEVARKFRNTSIYLDTSLLVYALGYAGTPRQAPCLELLQLLSKYGADVRCFTHTVDEVRASLEFCARMIDQAPMTELRGAVSLSIEHFIMQGHTASDILLFATQLEDSLKELNIQIVDKPAYKPDYMIDEKELSEVLQRRLPKQHPRARSRDVDSISAIVRLRRGRNFGLIEHCEALFVTTNRTLARSIQEFFREIASSHVIGPCLTDGDLTTLLWLKTPLRAPDLPRKRIIAYCFAATQPDEHLLRLYLDEIQRQRKRGTVTEEESYLLRYSMEAKEGLMEATLGDDEAFTQGTLEEILKHLRDKLTEEVLIKLDAEKEARVSAVDKANEAERKFRELAEERHQQEEARQRRLFERTQEITRWITVPLALLAFVIVMAMSCVPLFYDRPVASLIVVTVALAAMGAANLVWGVTVLEAIQKLQRHLEPKVLQLLKTIVGP